MFLWRRLAFPQWWIDNEEALRSRAGDQLAVIQRPGGKRLQLEVASESRTALRNLSAKFGGHVEKLSHDWLKQCLGGMKSKPLRIGKRLVITHTRVAATRSGRFQTPKAGPIWRSPFLVIPAGAAFGTGDHSTTAMSLRLLEQLTRKWKPDWSFVDLGTGSGILALAARCLGAKRVVGVDVDRMAISTAQENATRNNIGKVQFRLADARRWKLPAKTDVVAANLNSELLIAILPKLRGSRWSILSGVLRDQETELVRALKRHQVGVVQVRRRGKWIAVLATVG
jgi:ribosomal protein L11 methyltransferase